MAAPNPEATVSDRGTDAGEPKRVLFTENEQSPGFYGQTIVNNSKTKKTTRALHRVAFSETVPGPPEIPSRSV
jgi:hypothetical protein